MPWKEHFLEGKEIVLSTSSCDGVPRANIVISLGWADGRLLMADCQMKKTIQNLQDNPRACVIGGYIRLFGTVEILVAGPLFDRCVLKSKGYDVRHALVMTIVEVMDLDTGILL